MPRCCGRYRVRKALAATFFVCLWVLAPTTTWSASGASVPRVVVTIKPIHSLVERVMQGIGSPILIVDGSSSLHTFSLKPSAAKAIASADVFVGVSQELEPFSRRLISSLPTTADVVSVVAIPGLTFYPRREGGVFEAHDHGGHDDDHGHEDHENGPGTATDGHVWLDPKNAELIAVSIADHLAARYPDTADRIKANAAQLVDDIRRLDVEIGTSLNAIKGKPFIVFHDSTQYFERHFGIAAAGSVTLSPDVQPSGKRLAEVRKRIKALGAVCVFAEPSYRESQLAVVTEGTPARFGTLDAEGQMLPPGPDLYFVLMRGMAKHLRECLEQPSPGN